MLFCLPLTKFDTSIHPKTTLARDNNTIVSRQPPHRYTFEHIHEKKVNYSYIYIHSNGKLGYYLQPFGGCKKKKGACFFFVFFCKRVFGFFYSFFFPFLHWVPTAKETNSLNTLPQHRDPSRFFPS